MDDDFQGGDFVLTLRSQKVPAVEDGETGLGDKLAFPRTSAQTPAWRFSSKVGTGFLSRWARSIAVITTRH
jgi:hypothetical protein